MKNYVSNQSGRSMIEMLGVLAIVGVLSVAGIAGYSKAMAKYKTNKLIDQVSTVAANVRTTFAGQGNYKGLDDGTAYSLGIFPEEISKDCDINETTNIATCSHNAFGGFLLVISGDPYDKFSIGISEISKDACAALVTADWGPASSFAGIEGDADGCEKGICSLSVLKGKTVSMISELCRGTEGENDYALSLFFK